MFDGFHSSPWCIASRMYKNKKNVSLTSSKLQKHQIILVNIIMGVTLKKRIVLEIVKKKLSWLYFGDKLHMYERWNGKNLMYMTVKYLNIDHLSFWLKIGFQLRYFTWRKVTVTEKKIDDDFSFWLEVKVCLIGSSWTVCSQPSQFSQECHECIDCKSFATRVKFTTIIILLETPFPQAWVICNMYNVKRFTGIYPASAITIMSNHLSKVAKLSFVSFLSFDSPPFTHFWSVRCNTDHLTGSTQHH